MLRGILFTDLYQLTMAQLYFSMGLHEKRVQFEYSFRKYPNYGSHQAGFCIFAGLQPLVVWMSASHFEENDLDLLRHHKGSGGRTMFKEDFLRWLKAGGHFADLSLRAVPEGRVVHPDEPCAVVEGPLAMAQILESPLLNMLNYPTLVATKAARLRGVAGDEALIIDFGLRRAQGEAANAGTRAALIGGVDFSSNTGQSFALGYPPKGTHAHSMVQAFMATGASELDAFRAFADLYPDDCVLLVDTIDTLSSGMPNAIRVFDELKRKGHRPAGVRLDSGDLAYLSIQCARLLDSAGFKDARIVLSNQLDELVIWQILSQIRREALQYGVEPKDLIARLVYGVGTRLITSDGAPALDGVYKLVAVEHESTWQPAIKYSETPDKTAIPGRKEVWRLYDERRRAVADVIALLGEEVDGGRPMRLFHPHRPGVQRQLDQNGLSCRERILEDIVTKGHTVADLPSMESLRRRRADDIERLDEGVKRLINPHVYHVSLSEGLWNLRKGILRSGDDRSGPKHEAGSAAP
jgi:nicotinate phosphoribosyltransferase